METTELKAFVLMPFDKEFDDVYRFGIKEAASEIGIQAQRLDEQIFDGNMLQKIYQEIDTSDIIIADMSNRNPNVFYEVGYADARSKLIILMTRNKDDIPFDLLHRPHIIYEDSISKLKEELIQRLSWATKESLKRKIKPIISKLKTSGAYILRNDYSDNIIVNFNLEIHNISDKVIKNIHSIYLYVGNEWNIKCDGKLCTSTKSEIENFKYRHIIHPGFNSITAKDWLPLEVEMERMFFATWMEEGNAVRKDSYDIEGIIKIQINTDSGTYLTDEFVQVKAEYTELPF